MLTRIKICLRCVSMCWDMVCCYVGSLWQPFYLHIRNGWATQVCFRHWRPCKALANHRYSCQMTKVQHIISLPPQRAINTFIIMNYTILVCLCYPNTSITLLQGGWNFASPLASFKNPFSFFRDQISSNATIWDRVWWLTRFLHIVYQFVLNWHMH